MLLNKPQPDSMAPYEFINNFHTKKLKWNDLSAKNKKTFSIYMVNRFLSMNMDYVDIINEMQICTKALSKEEVFNLYMELIPSGKSKYSKFIINNRVKLFDDRVVACVSAYFKCSLRDATDYADTLIKTNQQAVLRDVMSSFMSDEDIDKILNKN